VYPLLEYSAVKAKSCVSFDILSNEHCETQISRGSLHCKITILTFKKLSEMYCLSSY